MSTRLQKISSSLRPAVCLAMLLTADASLPAAGAGANPRLPPAAGVYEAALPADMDEWLRRLVGRYRFEGMVEVVYAYEDYFEHRCGPLPPDPAEQQSQEPEFPPVPYCSNISGMGDCVAIGSGPGVQCVLSVTWNDMYEMDEEGVFQLPGGVSNLSPSMLLLGVDRTNASLNYLLVDQKGLPEGGLGQVLGNRATFRTECVNGPRLLGELRPEFIPPPEFGGRTPQDCERILRIDARPDAKVLHMTMEIAINGEVFTRHDMTLRRVQAPAGR